ncbi:MAG: acyl-CoA dehydrogenase family protein [Acidobacteriota bacterium]
MEFSYTEEQQLLRDTMRRFAEKEIRPNVGEWDEAQKFPAAVVDGLGKMGMLGIMVPAEWGGAALRYIDYIIIMEEISRVDASVGLILAAHNGLCCTHILLAGNDDQKSAYLAPLASGQKLGAWALTEPSSGSDAASAQTTARLDGQHWVLNGTKSFCTNANYADVFVVVAVTDPGKEAKGLSAFIIEKGTGGLTIGKKENKLGMRASDTASLLLDDCRIPAANLLGERGQGFIGALQVLERGRIAIAALSVGIAQGAFEAAARYAGERVQFGKPISAFQGIQWKLADMATRIEAGRLLTYQAAVLRDLGQRCTLQSSMAKLFASEAAVWVAEEAIQIHGGYGFIKDYPVEKFWRDSKLCTIGEGTSEIQRMIIAREILQQYRRPN